LRLDVGCGPNPRGDVNCDCFKDYTPEWNPTKKVKIKGENFVCCSGEYLPFQNEVFDLVVSIHVIEHTIQPHLFLKEMLRVSKSKVLLRCPHRFGSLAKMSYHRTYFNCQWFRNELRGLNAEVSISKYRKGFPSDYCNLLRLPEEIIVKVIK